jgi:hypothetical protein
VEASAGRGPSGDEGAAAGAGGGAGSSSLIDQAAMLSITSRMATSQPWRFTVWRFTVWRFIGSGP